MDCAWCMIEQGIELGEGSHGICPTHAEEQWNKWQELKASRAEATNEREVVSEPVAA